MYSDPVPDTDNIPKAERKVYLWDTKRSLERGTMERQGHAEPVSDLPALPHTTQLPQRLMLCCVAWDLLTSQVIGQTLFCCDWSDPVLL